jgi:DNA-binding transcriptional LysR family regulator
MLPSTVPGTRVNKLASMMTFVRVVESGSLTAAARQLGISVSAVAKGLARLEEELQTQLLVRSTRKVTPNDDGRMFYARCQQILNDIEDAEGALRDAREGPKGRLRMAMPVLFGRLTFLPRAAQFHARYPQIVLDIAFEDRRLALIERGLDLAVQVGELRDSGYIRRELHRGLRLTAASPAYLARNGIPRAPADLAKHNCITASTSPVWRFRENARDMELPVRGNLVVTGGDALREAALLDLGIVQSNWWTLAGDVASGKLTPLLERYSVEGGPLSVVYPPTRHVPRKVRVMVDFLVEITRIASTGERGQSGRRRAGGARKNGQTVFPSG